MTSLYRIRFKLRSAIVTPLKGDTIWGHIVWGIANNEGPEKVAEFLGREKTNPPELVVSSAFPAGMVCRPLPSPKDRDGSLDTVTYSKIKQDKKKKYELASEFFAEAVDAPYKALLEKKLPHEKAEAMHNTIDRSTNTVLEGGLYSTEELWPRILDWDFYVLSSLGTDRIKELVGWAFENGYGADASTGKGKIDEIGDPVPVTAKEKGNSYMALGPFVAPKNGMNNLRADIFIRSGKLGGAFASSLPPHKKTAVLYDEGAVFNCDEDIQYVGGLLEKMHGTEEFNICQSGFAPVIPIRV